mgnify:CR=1 FL=1
MRNITYPINDKLFEPTNGVGTLGDLSFWSPLTAYKGTWRFECPSTQDGMMAENLLTWSLQQYHIAQAFHLRQTPS